MRILLTLVLVLGTTAPATAHPPAVSSVTVFADDVPGPEGIAFAADRTMIVGTAIGEVRRYAPDASYTVVGNAGEPLAGITVLRDGRILAASAGPGRVWSIDPTTGMATVFASGIASPNFIVQARDGRIFVSASSAGTVVEITDGMPVDRVTGLNFTNGLALRDGYLYVAETLVGRVSRVPMADDGSFGAPETYATGMLGADGIAFDRRGNLLVVGFDMMWVVARGTTTGTPLSNDPLLDWPSNAAFGRGRGFARKDVFLVNFGAPLGSGTTIVRVGYNHTGLRVLR